MYLTGVKGPLIEPHLDAGTLGLLVTPNSRYAVKEGWTVAYDNGAFNADTYVGDAAWYSWLERQPLEGALFATAPDVVGDHEATVKRSAVWLIAIRALGHKVAFVAQDGMTVDNTNWSKFDVLFIGGSTEWKLGPQAEACIKHALSIGMPVHVGRVNSGRRYQRFAQLGVTSADGTYLAFGPDRNLPRLLGWLEKHKTQGTLC